MKAIIFGKYCQLQCLAITSIFLRIGALILKITVKHTLKNWYRSTNVLSMPSYLPITSFVNWKNPNTWVPMESSLHLNILRIFSFCFLTLTRRCSL